MNCEDCEKGLLELSYGELDESAAVTTRAHIETCASCRSAFQKIETGRAFARKLDVVPAPSMATVLAAAREQAALNRAAREQPVDTSPVAQPRPREESSPDDSGLSGWLRWLGAVVMGPQLGVATVLLLVVGIGLYYLPQLGGGAGRGVAPVLEPDPQQTSETSALAPAEPLQLTHDPRTGRVTAEDEGPVEEPTTSPRREPRVGPPIADREAEGTGTQGTPDPMDEIEQAIPGDPTPGEVRSDSLPELTTAAGSLESDPLPPSAEVWSPPTATPSTSPAPSAPATERAPQAQQFDMDSVPSGVRADDLGAAALHGQARQLAAANRCADSVARYQQLQSRYPEYPEGGRASVEMAECLRRLGRAREARVALDRATRSPVPAVASAARRQLVEMEAEDRAATSAAEPTASE